MHIFVFPVGAGVDRRNGLGSASKSTSGCQNDDRVYATQTYLTTFTSFSIPC